MAQSTTPARRGIGYYLLGTPRRFLITLAVGVIGFAAFLPDEAAVLGNNVVSAFARALGPSAPKLIVIAIAVWAIWYLLLKPLFSMFKPKKKQGSGH